MVGRNLSQPFRFICITDQSIAGVECKAPVVEYEGWWQKIGLFACGFAPGPALYLDLDVVVCGFLDEYADIACTLQPESMRAPNNWAQSGHGGVQSSVMIWKTAPRKVFDTFDYEIESERLHGDQCWLTQLRDDQTIDCGELNHVYSYKYHCMNKRVPTGAKVIVFHGKPDPHEVTDQWVRMARY
jgi:hypothetical protein